MNLYQPGCLSTFLHLTFATSGIVNDHCNACSFTPSSDSLFYKSLLGAEMHHTKISVNIINNNIWDFMCLNHDTIIKHSIVKGDLEISTT